MGVRNKYCAVCNKAGNDTPPDHTCYLNWKGSLANMEADIIMEGFKKCEEQHGVRFVSNGDSSVYHTYFHPTRGIRY